MACNCCSSEFNRRNFVLSGERIEGFALPQVKCRPIFHITWFIYRYLVAVYLTIWLGLILWQFGEEPFYAIRDSKWKWFIQVSNWSYIITIVYFYTAAFNSSYYFYNRDSFSSEHLSIVAAKAPNYNSGDNSPDSSAAEEVHVISSPVITPWHCKVQWCLQVVCYGGVLFITVMYWIGVSSASGDPVSAYILHVHGITLSIAIIDAMFVANQTRLCHCVYLFLFGLIYFFFTLIYWAAGGNNGRDDGGTYIYKRILDWGEMPGTTVGVFVFSIAILLPLCHLFFYGLYRLKCVLYRRFAGVSQTTDDRPL